MLVLHSPAELPPAPGGVCVALGMFDGVHLGHQHVIRQAQVEARVLGARSVVATFDPHPLAVVAPAKAPRLLQTTAQRLRAIAGLGIDAALVLPFDAALSRVPGEEFVRRLAAGFGRLRSFTVGQGFHFGHQRSGNVPLLRTLGRELGFTVHPMAPVSIGSEAVSSTRVRTALREGRLSLVAELLARPYAVSGRVLAGDRLGRQLGFPTANLDIAGLELPPAGVYAGRVRLDGRDFLAAMNLGRRPTLRGREPELRCEAHLLDYAGDLYGRELEVEVLRLLRPERSFAGLEALREQIARDVDAVRRLAG